MIRRTAILLIVLAAAILPADRARALDPHVRDGWILGVSYGGATGNINFTNNFPNNAEAEVKDGVSPQIHFGHMLGRKFALGASYIGWMYETGEVPIKYRFSMQNVLLNGTWFPGSPDNALGGLRVRFGLGYAWSAIAEVEIKEDEEQSHGDRRVDSGLGLELNVGYEFRVYRTTSVGLGVGIVAQSLDGDLYQDTVYTPVTLNFNWYW